MNDRDFITSLRDQCNAHLGAVTPPNPPPPVDPVVPPVAPPNGQKPAPAGWVIGPDLTGTSGNPKLCNNIPAGCAARYRFSGSGRFQFTTAGQSFDGTPPAVWVWLESAAGYVTTPARFGGQGTCPVDAIVSGEVWLCEQIEAPGGQWNRYAQVNAMSTGGR